jgi:chromosome segregation ATPase
MMHKSIVKVEKLIKKHKKEFAAAKDDTEKMKQKKEVHSLEIRKVKKDDLLLKLEEEIKNLEKKNLELEKKAKEEAEESDESSDEEEAQEKKSVEKKPDEKKADKAAAPEKKTAVK